MRNTILATLILGSAIFAQRHELNAARPGSGFTGIIDLTARDWWLTTEHNGDRNGLGALANSPFGGGLLFNFIESTPELGATDNYLVADVRPKGNRKQAISGTMQMRFLLTTQLTDPVFGGHPGDAPTLPPSARFFISRGNWAGPDGDRWWSNPIAYPLQATSVELPPTGAFGAWNNVDGTVTMAVPLDPAYWSGVFGEWANRDQQTLSWFSQVLSGASYVGICFGRGDAFCHGVNVVQGTGHATFELKEFTIR